MEDNLTWWRSRVEVTSGNIEQEKYNEAIRFSRHVIYNLNTPDQSTILMAPLSKEAGGYGLCLKNNGKPVFENASDKGYIAIFDAVNNSSEYLNSIKRFDMEEYVVSPDYFREMKRFGVIANDVPIEEVNPYVVDKVYWDMKKKP
jgi:hypothetical protein